MGNGSSQSVILGPPSRFQQSYVSAGNNFSPAPRWGGPKYAHPQNRVLPKPVAGQRLRSTDNGSILQNAGTLRGLRREDSTGKGDAVDPEMMGILRRRSEMIEKENDCYHHLNLRNHRLFHSDPNIARRPGDDMPDPYVGTSRRNCKGGAAVRASKLKTKKKAKAPQPPGSLPRQLERKSSGDRTGAVCKCVSKTRAPQPPAILVHPPPPPPLPATVTTRTGIGITKISIKNDNSESGLPGGFIEGGRRARDELSSAPQHMHPSEVTRSVECSADKVSYEKNVHPLEKWRNYKSAGDVRIDEESDHFPMSSRTTVFDSRKLTEPQNKVPGYLPQKPDPFQKEIREVTKKIAERCQQLQPTSPKPPEEPLLTKTTSASTPLAKSKEVTSPPKFYFADPTVFRVSQKTDSNVPKTPVSPNPKPIVTLQNQENRNHAGDSKKANEPIQSKTIVDEIVPSLQRFSPGRRRFKCPSPTNVPQKKSDKEWENLSRNLFNKQESISNIDIRLRPVLPRKSTEAPRNFSPTEAWQALGSDGFGSSNHSTSDDGPDLGRFRDPRVDRRNDFGMWTPRQDLLDDSDACSEDSEEAVVPRMRSSEISTRFSLPTVMFSNMRPIGSEGRSNSAHSSYAKHAKKKSAKQLENGPGHFRRFLSKRNRFMSEEDIMTAADSNWTFGQNGLQKRGKQYSSELLLSDKKKNEWMSKGDFSDFLGDILVSKADHMRRQLRSSESGNSNFSFYSTEGQIMYRPETGGFFRGQDESPGFVPDSSRNRVRDIRQRFDAAAPDLPRSNLASRKKQSEVELGLRRDLELAKMLEDEVRKRRNKEKISIRQQLQRLKSGMRSDEEEFDDEAYFTEPKSREESQSPFFRASTSDLGGMEPAFHHPVRGIAPPDPASRLSHWQSSPALLEDSFANNGMQASAKGRLSLSSVMSSPDSGACASWIQTGDTVDSWLRRQQLGGHLSEREISKGGRLTASSGDGDVSSSPTPAPAPKKERRKTNIYKQLMDIVRKEERHLRNVQRGEDPASRESSCSGQRESCSSSCSSESSCCSYSDSSGGRKGVPANREFGYSRAVSSAPATPFQASFAQPYSPGKGYRHVPFEPQPYRLPGLREEGKHVSAEVS